MNESAKVTVLMSGGVDSSLAAALLKEAGHDVTGVFIKVWHPPFLDCTSKLEETDAARVAAHIDIPFTTVDLKEAYKREVADYLIEEYSRGRTPNPDVMCNTHVKFGACLTWAKENGFDAIATGHYARVVRDEDGTAHLQKGVDENKDQSYFLWNLSQEVLRKVYFPIGEYEKPKVRDMARERKLPTADKKDSQGVCFLGQLDMREFLGEFIELTPGNVLDAAGAVIGRHEGALTYTLGQRHGFTVDVQSPTSEPLYVVAKDIEQNTITVAPRTVERRDYSRSEFTLEQTSFLAGNAPSDTQFRARFRYRQPLFDATCTFTDGTLRCTTPQAHAGAASGQSFVLYKEEECIGGGVLAD